MAEHSEYEIKIHNRSGIPVIEIAGNFNKSALKLLESTIGKLASAGHYHIVLNVRKAAALNSAMFSNLKKAAESVAKHYGAIDVVGEASQIGQLLSINNLTKVFRFCTSENEAIKRIKRLARVPDPDEPAFDARIKESR